MHEETGFEGEAGFHSFPLKVRRDAPAAISGFRDGSGNPESGLFQSIESVVSSNFSLELREPGDEGTGSLLIISSIFNFSVIVIPLYFLLSPMFKLHRRY